MRIPRQTLCYGLHGPSYDFFKFGVLPHLFSARSMHMLQYVMPSDPHTGWLHSCVQNIGHPRLHLPFETTCKFGVSPHTRAFSSSQGFLYVLPSDPHTRALFLLHFMSAHTFSHVAIGGHGALTHTTSSSTHVSPASQRPSAHTSAQYACGVPPTGSYTLHSWKSPHLIVLHGSTTGQSPPALSTASWSEESVLHCCVAPQEDT
mmetsp:Transcript_11023/g.23644  ORF Transcript_11023/g.23644 Transcript_11023/m.23644 type:complete len:204 (-) Transcript_11023:371-982(-)